MKTVEEWAVKLFNAAFSDGSSGRDGFMALEGMIDAIRREQHEATIHALQDSYLKTGVYRASFESTQED